MSGGREKKKNKQPQVDKKVVSSTTTTDSSSGITQQLNQVKINDNNGIKQIQFPSRPPRTGQVPGQVVRLISNMMMMSLKQNKPIYKHGMTISFPEQEADTNDDKKTPKKERKVPSSFKRHAVKLALERWIKQQKPKEFNKNIQYNYAFDMNASTIYTLFKLDFSPESGNSPFLVVLVPSEDIVGGKLTNSTTECEVKINQGTQLDVKLLFDACKNGQKFDILGYSELIRMLNVLLHERIYSMPTHLTTKHNVFPFKKENLFPIGYRENFREPPPKSTGVIYCKGYSMSARPSEAGVLLNLSNTGRSFLEPLMVVDFIQKKFNLRDLNRPLYENNIADIKRELCTKQVEATHFNYGTPQRPHYRKYRVSGITSLPCCQEKFTMIDKTTKKVVEKTVQQYFKEEYKFNLKYPNLPCIQTSNGAKIPLEACKIVEKQGIARKQTPEETTNIINKMAVKPEVHFQMIKDHKREVLQNNQPLKDFGIDVDPEFIEVDGRELKPFCLEGGRGSKLEPSDGQYRTPAFFRPVIVKFWGVLVVGDRFMERDKDSMVDNGKKFAQFYQREASTKGVKIDPNGFKFVDYLPLAREVRTARAELRKRFERWNTDKIEHVFVVIPEKCDDWVYPFCHYLEVSSGKDRKQGERFTRISCIKYNNYMRKIINADRGREMFLGNLALKYNTKMGGINVIISPKNNANARFLEPGYIFFSVDVCHPAPGDRLIQSVSAVVGMWDLSNQNLTFSTQMRVQKKKNENDSSTIEDVKDIGIMMKNILIVYQQRKKSLPSKIVILRDGVSEGQYGIVLSKEIQRVRQTIGPMYVNNKIPYPGLTCIVVQKRNKTRFMRKQPIQSRNGPDHNIQPGTVVDNTITHPTDHEFYLAPHKAIQGTSRPARYYLVLDELRFSQDDVQAMVNALSYLSPRCTKSTSVPTPINLADLAAERGKNFVISWNEENTQKMQEGERIDKLNTFLSSYGDANFMNTLFYV